MSCPFCTNPKCKWVPPKEEYPPPGSEVFGLTVVIILAVALGFFSGWVMRGGL